MISIYYKIGFTVRTGTVKNQLAFIIPFSQGGNNRGVVSKYAKEYREFSPYANFITANFITAVFQNYY